MELMNQPLTGQLGERIVELLESDEFHTLNIIVAFAKNSGVLRIKEALKSFKEKGGKVNIYVGIDLGGTSYEALTALLLHTDSLNVVHAEKSQTFHSKIYQFSGKHKEIIIVGSHNLTGGGLWTNFESSVHVWLDASGAEEVPLLNRLNEHIHELKSLEDSFMSIDTQDDIEQLLENGYVFKEVAERVRWAKSAKKRESYKSLFGKGVSAKLPRIATSKKAKAVAAPKKAKSVAPPAEPAPFPSSDQGQTIWFETRKMTGGSRNILDLSMRSLVESGDPTGTQFDLGEEGFMRGGVGFFGLNPEDTDSSKNITINFEGVDYKDNTIKFAKANGSWRLQIKGTSSNEKKITDSLKAKDGGDYLVEKIVTFTKVEGDYYFMSVYLETELENFKAASNILARNGANKMAKLLGVL